MQENGYIGKRIETIIKKRKYIFACLFAMCSTFALMGDVSKIGFYNISGNNLLATTAICIFLIALYVTIITRVEKLFFFGLLVISFIVSTINIKSQCLYYGSSISIFLQVVFVLGYATLFYFLVLGFPYLKELVILFFKKNCFQKKFEYWLKKRFLYKYYLKHPMLFLTLCIMICWLPWIIFFYPGCVNWDLFVQLNQAFGITPLSNQHPVLSTLYAGGCVKIGRWLGSDSFGVFLYFLSRAIICSTIYAYVIQSLKRWKVNKIVRCVFLLFYCLNPVFGAYFVSGQKDIWFATFMSLFITCIISYFVEKDYMKKRRNFVILMLSIVLSCLVRSNGLYVLIPSCFLILLYVYKNKGEKSIYACILSAFIVVYIVNHFVFMGIMGVASGKASEAFSIPFQQTARYIQKYDSEITAEEKTIISKVLDYEAIKKNYNSKISDPVKGTYHAANNSELMDYWKVWLKMFFKHPGVYCEAFIAQSSGYYMFGPKTYSAQMAGNTNCGMSFTFYISNTTLIDTTQFDLKFLKWTEKGRKILESWARNFEKIPLLGLLYSCAFWSWITIYHFWQSIKRKDWMQCCILLPVLLSIMVCTLSPVNDCFRYFIPVVTMLSVYLCFLLREEYR